MDYLRVQRVQGDCAILKTLRFSRPKWMKTWANWSNSWLCFQQEADPNLWKLFLSWIDLCCWIMSVGRVVLNHLAHFLNFDVSVVNLDVEDASALCVGGSWFYNMSGCLSFLCRVCAIVCEEKHSCSNGSFRGVCTLVSWEVWSAQWEAALCNHLRLQNPVGCWGWLCVEPLHLCLWPLVNKRLLEAAGSSSPAQISSAGANPSVRRAVLPPWTLLWVSSAWCCSHLPSSAELQLPCIAEKVLTWCKGSWFNDEWGWYC